MLLARIYYFNRLQIIFNAWKHGHFDIHNSFCYLLSVFSLHTFCRWVFLWLELFLCNANFNANSPTHSNKIKIEWKNKKTYRKEMKTEDSIWKWWSKVSRFTRNNNKSYFFSLFAEPQYYYQPFFLLFFNSILQYVYFIDKQNEITL